MTCYTMNGVTYNEADLVAAIMKQLNTDNRYKKLAAVLYKKKDPVEILEDLKREGTEALIRQKNASKGNLPYISTTSFITAKHSILGGRLLTPELDQAARRNQFIKDHAKDVEFHGDETAAGEAFDEQIRLEGLNNNVGSYIHNFVHIMLDESLGRNSAEYKLAVSDLEDALKADNYTLAKALVENDSKMAHEDIQGISKKIIELADNIVRWVNTTFPKKSRKALFSEIPMLLKNSPTTYLSCINRDGVMRDYEGLLGIADLIIVDNDGKVHLIDFKVCSRPYNQWYDAKNNEVEYQLAIYRGILTSAGFNGDDIDLILKPVLFLKNNISSLQEQASVSLTDASYKGASRVAWRGGTFTHMLRSLGIGAKPIYMNTEDSDLEEAINSDYDKIMGVHEDPKAFTKQFFIDHDKILEDKDASGKVIGYKMWSKLEGPGGGWIKAKTKEEFTKEGGLIDNYVKELEDSRNSILRTIIKEIGEFKDEKKSGKKSGKSSFLKSEKNPERRQLLQRYLGKYIDYLWSCISEQLPVELIDHGILVFQKMGDNGDPILDIVMLAEGPLTQNVLVNGSYNILGKYKSDEEVKTLPFTPMKSQFRNIKALEAVSIINTVLNRHPDIFNGSSIGNFLVLNPNGLVSDQDGIDMSQLLDNFNFLCGESQGNIKNSIQNVKMPTTYEYCMSELLGVLTSIGEDDELGQLLHDIDHGTETLRLKKQKVANLLIALRNKYPQLRNLEFGKHGQFNMNDPAVVCYLILSQMNNYLHGIKIDFDGRIPKWAVSFNEIFSLLGVPLIGKQALVDSTGDNIVGLGNGLDFSSPRTTRSNTLRQLNAYYDVVYNNVRLDFTKKSTYITDLTKKYVKNFATGGLLELASSSNLKVWERLLVHDGDKLNPQMLIKNPYDMSNDLTTLDREFLKEYLWEINKYFMNDPSLDENWHYKDHETLITQSQAFLNFTASNDGRYFHLPLARSGTFQRTMKLPDYGIQEWFKAKWKDFEETYDPRALHNERRKQIKRNDIVEMFNAYDLGTADRQALIESVKSPYDFSMDLDFLAVDVLFHTVRKRHFDNALLLTETVTTMMQYQMLTTGADMNNEIDAAITLSQIMKGEPTDSEELGKISKGVGIVRLINSFALLACRPLQFLKELTFGMFTNYSRAWALKYTSSKLSIESVSKANAIIWGLRLKKYGKALTGLGSFADFYLCEKINRLYGIANEDLNRLSENQSMGRVGVLNNMSRWMYLAQSAPDYYNRLTLFIAKMIEDGCFEAHSLDENGDLVYDWKKDKRFSELAKHGLNSDYSSPEYNRQKALYAKMCSEFEKGEADLIKWNAEKLRYEYGDIELAYTADERASIKEVADTAYGFYDHESKSQFNHKFLGLVFLQFQTFLSAKYNLWFKGSTTKGRNTAQGKFVEMVRNGIHYYDRHIIDPNTGQLLGVKAVPENELTDEEKRTLLPTMEWLGDFVEGLFYSIGYTLHDIITLNWKEVANNKQRLANALLGLHDILIGILFVSILRAIFSDGSGKTKDISPLKRVMLRGMEDVGPGALTQVSITPSFVQTWANIKSDGIKLLFNGSEDAIDTMTKHFGATRDFIWE